MNGLVHSDQSFVQQVNDKIHTALQNQATCYCASRYSEVLQHNTEELFAIVIVDTPTDWKNIIDQTLTTQEQELIQPLSDDVWQKTFE